MEPIYVYVDFTEIEMPVQIYKGTNEQVVRALVSERNIQQIMQNTSGVCGVWAERDGNTLNPETLEPEEPEYEGQETDEMVALSMETR